jgi:hypothetical protein
VRQTRNCSGRSYLAALRLAAAQARSLGAEDSEWSQGERDSQCKTCTWVERPLVGRLQWHRIRHGCLRHLIQTNIIGENARAVTSPESHPDLHAYSHFDYHLYCIAHSPEELLTDALRAHRALWSPTRVVVRRRPDSEGPAVIEA